MFYFLVFLNIKIFDWVGTTTLILKSILIDKKMSFIVFVVNVVICHLSKKFER